MNAHISKEINQWVPSFQRRIALLLCVWFIPFVGIVIAYKSLDLDWFKEKSKSASSGQISMGGAFLEIDAIFNPSQKHVAEAKQKEVIEKKEDGEMYKKDILDIHKLKSTSVPGNKV